MSYEVARHATPCAAACATAGLDHSSTTTRRAAVARLKQMRGALVFEQPQDGFTLSPDGLVSAWQAATKTCAVPYLFQWLAALWPVGATTALHAYRAMVPFIGTRKAIPLALSYALHETAQAALLARSAALIKAEADLLERARKAANVVNRARSMHKRPPPIDPGLLRAVQALRRLTTFLPAAQADLCILLHAPVQRHQPTSRRHTGQPLTPMRRTPQIQPVAPNA